jgi:hypothetical protein
MRLPGIVRFAVWLTFFNTWVLFEETVVDRYGLYEYMPYYRVGKLCSRDIGAMVTRAESQARLLEEETERADAFAMFSTWSK